MVLRILPISVLFFLALLNPPFARAQNEATFWYFGYHAGLSFKDGNPRPLKDGVIKSDHGSATISDKDTGDLLFYTDGRNFWNNNHELMPSSNLPDKCWTQVTQPAIIVPDSENKDLFNVFCLRFPEEIESSFASDCIYGSKMNVFLGMQLYYFLIDMRLDNGKGDIVKEQSNILVRTDVTEKLTAIPNTDRKGYWILVHGWNNNKFFAYPLSSTLLGKPVISNIGSFHQVRGGVDSQEIRGYMKASPNGRKIACAISDDIHSADLFDFDASTGLLTNYINLGNLRGQYGLSFSPDNSKLYLSTDSPPDKSLKYIIMQYDLEVEDSAAIASSGMSIILDNPYTNIPDHGIFDGFDEARKGFQLGLDGRLYVTSHASLIESAPGILVVIEEPNKKGFDCQVNFQRFDFGEGRPGLGLPNFIQSYFNGLEPIEDCEGKVDINLYPNPTTGSVKVEVNGLCTGEYSYSIFNALGQVVSSSQITSSLTEIDLSPFADGLYIVQFISNTTKISKKVYKISGK